MVCRLFTSAFMRRITGVFDLIWLLFSFIERPPVPTFVTHFHFSTKFLKNFVDGWVRISLYYFYSSFRTINQPFTAASAFRLGLRAVQDIGRQIKSSTQHRQQMSKFVMHFVAQVFKLTGVTKFFNLNGVKIQIQFVLEIWIRFCLKTKKVGNSNSKSCFNKKIKKAKMRSWLSRKLMFRPICC